jgi:two-component system, cell cycle response regulator
MASADETWISPVGFGGREVKTLEMILKLTEKRTQKYCLHSKYQADCSILLINADERELCEKVLKKTNIKPYLFIGEMPGVREDLQISRPIRPSRLIDLLDHLNPRQKNASPSQKIEIAFESTGIGSSQTNVTRMGDAGSRYHVLIVDDSRAVRQIISEKISEQGIATVAVPMGDIALHLLQQEKFDMVFLDVEMPEKDGFEVCKMIKSNADTRSLPVCMLTGKGSAINKIRGKISGCDDYLTKPVSLRDLFNVVQKYLPKK